MPVEYPAGEVPGGTDVLGQPREHDAGLEPVTVPGHPAQPDGPARDRVSAAAGHARPPGWRGEPASPRPPPQRDGRGLDRWKSHMESTSKQLPPHVSSPGTPGYLPRVMPVDRGQEPAKHDVEFFEREVR